MNLIYRIVNRKEINQQLFNNLPEKFDVETEPLNIISFGEYDRGYNIQESNVLLKELIKNYFIEYKTGAECKEIIKTLILMGYTVFNSDDILNMSNSRIENDKWRAYIWNVDKFVRVKSNTFNKKNMTFDEFIKLLNSKIKLKKNPDIDPFGEEDWGYTVQESISNFPNFTVFVKNHVEFKDLMVYLQQNGVKWVSGTSPTSMSPMKNVYIFYRDTDKRISWSCDPYLQHGDIIKLSDLKKIKKKTCPDIDPYDEEDWGYTVQESISNIPNLFSVFVKTHEEFKELMVYLEQNGAKWTSGIKPTSMSPMKNVYISYTNKRITWAYHTFHKEIGDAMTFDEFSKLFNSKIKFKKNPDIDPYEEDDWGYTIQESDSALKRLIKNYCIVYETGDECKDIIEKLETIGYSVYNRGYILKMSTEEIESEKWRAFRYLSEDLMFVRTSEHVNLKSMTYEEFCEIIGKNIKIKKNPDIDPYEEDDWGYTVQESFNDNDSDNDNDNDLQVGDSVLVLPKLEYHIHRHKWNIVLNQLIGNIYKIELILKSRVSEEFDTYYLNCPERYYVYSDCLKKIASKKINYHKRPDIDPYDEEDWGYTIQESIVPSLEFIKNYYIMYTNGEQCKQIVKIFAEIGCEVYNREMILNMDDKSIEDHGFFAFVWSDKDNYFVRTSYFDHLNLMTFEDFFNLVKSKNITKIKNPDIDPYEEDDWGYIQETNIKKIDFDNEI